jgi:uncharacterized small protein (DUF1192 family)
MDTEEDRPKKRREIAIGEDLATLSVEELKRRIETLEQEISRYKAAIAEKQKSKDAANSVFKL